MLHYIPPLVSGDFAIASFIYRLRFVALLIFVVVNNLLNHKMPYEVLK